MPSSPAELEESLKAFRLEILNAFANIQMEIESLQAAVVEAKPVSRKRLEEIQQAAAKRLGKFLDHYAQRIGPAYERR